MQRPVNQTTSTNLNWWNWETKPLSSSVYHDWEAFKHDAKARYYSVLDADAGRALFSSTLKRLKRKITSSSVVHDNGSHGAATSVVLDMLDAKFKDEIPEILIIAATQRSVDNANECYANWAPRITAIRAESQDLSGVPVAKFTHCISLFGVFQFPYAPRTLREIHRTLQADGVAVLLAWRQHGWLSIIHNAQRLVRPDLPLYIFSVMGFRAEGVLLDFVVEAGFSEEKVEVRIERTIRKGEHIDEMKKSLLRDATRDSMTEGWSDEEKGRWPAAVGVAIQNEVELYGGVLFEAWTAIAQK